MPSPCLSRSRLRSWFLVAVITSIGAGLLAGLVYALVATARGDAEASTSPVQPTQSTTTEPSPASAAAEQAQRDALAAAPMPQLPPSAALPRPLTAAQPPPAIELPRPRTTEPIATGFPRTPEGALAQLAAIDAAALKGLSPSGASAAYDWAALPGAVAVRRWTPMVAVRAALRGAGAPTGSPEVQSTFTPLAGHIKGTVGDDFAVVCVLGEWQVTYRSTTRAGAADCQRMLWRDGRWRIGPGAQPAYPPSAWPGSEDAARVGWRPLTGWSVTGA